MNINGDRREELLTLGGIFTLVSCLAFMALKSLGWI